MHPGPNAPAKSRFDRLILSNILEWAQQPERQPLPQFSALPGSQRFPEEEMALYWSGDHKIVVTRHPMDDTHIADISAILGYVEQLQKVDLKGVEPTYQVTGLKNVMRPDVIKDYGVSPEALLKNAPATEKGHIKVKRMLT